MQIGVLNRRAQERYATFTAALDMIGEILGEVDKLIATVDDKASADSWTTATQDELKALRTRAFEELDHLRTLGKKHEAELISREWRF
ncbi:hypothetical protein ACFWY9_29715 [Amycolatopsis sp. NPDC059027]|uniref:hypothetical protein n=1 Tax=Amycolatopsis sp. NPDC059027 TaxID=3346709 RepID=UPI0036729FF6